MTTVISHFYNEEFLLPIWLNHHKQRFENGILINFNSTDSSVEIIRSLVPNWKIIGSTSEFFGAEALDRQIIELEEQIRGVRIALTVTEFFLGNPAEINKETFIPTIDLVNMPHDREFDPSKPWHEQRKWGYHYRGEMPGRLHGRGRKISNRAMMYDPGRHYVAKILSGFLIYRVANCLVNQKMIDRKLQIQERIPQTDVDMGFGVQHHNYGKGLKIDDVLKQQIIDQKLAVDLSEEIELAVIREQLSLINSEPFKDFKLSLMQNLDRRAKLYDEEKLNSEVLNNEIKNLQVELEQVRAENKLVVSSLINQNEQLNKIIAEIKNSFSWKITKIFRFLKRYLVKLK